MLPVLRDVAQNVLVPKLDSDLLGDVGQLVEVFDGELASAGGFRDFRQQAGAGEFFLHIADEFDTARRFLAFVSDRYLFNRRTWLFPWQN